MTTSTTSCTLITLSNHGDRLIRVSLEMAQELTKRWESELTLVKGSIIGALDLACRVYPPASAKHICSFLSDKVGSVRVALLNDIIASLPTIEGLATLEAMNGLLERSPLVELNLDDNALGIRGVKLLKGILSRPTLESLCIRNDGMSAESMPILGDALATACPETGKCALDNIKELHIYNNMIGEEGAKATGQILAKCPSLSHLQYEGCRPGPAGSLALVEGLLAAAQNNINVQSLHLELSLGSNKSEPVGVLCQVLKNYTKLKDLKLYDCGLEASGCTLILQSLPPNLTGLVSLAMSQNEMNARTVRKHVIPLLERNISTLQVLQLENNEITSVGVESLCQVINSASDVALRELKLSENLIGSRGVTALIATKSSMPHLSKLTMDLNGFPEELVNDLKECYGPDVIEDMDDLEEDNFDDDLEKEAASDEEEEDVQEIQDADVDDIANAMGKVKVVQTMSVVGIS